ncbi:MAG: flagellar hook assembly protein FlgD [Gammaproteobacteria bacterium]|jgi:flagellar basal-body rod modification protein FlgD|nr:flagellar hook assembly protein FlgD [Gammaproteobacteria bacterium]MBU1506746.1 flagellar hook assembly protein FlgD [Gammaproteobacteria bacterium]MBU2120626.1 flagellar hook assembly protein FlgD [Gammaproteobacteria bacterium]MBU2168990.1 flagellar hook assembly protein FlgD [Gammaproteobacteria bacterium]MBU2201083.1 flagellar hook assembly protein FlgD [Gammaproteobacteria bacterium]
MINSVTNTSPTADTAGTKAAAANDNEGAQDRFLKLLVAQLNNQDPMNPLDNAQMTSQIAQINTVTGIQQLNFTMLGIAEQFSSMQTLQGSTMIDRTVVLEGDKLAVAEGVGKGMFDLKSTAKDVKVEILTPGGQLVGTVNLDAKEAGRHEFEWDASKYTGSASDLKFKVTALDSKGVAVESTPLIQSKVVGTGASDGQLTLNLANGATVTYDKVRSVL